jgi:hypothetical protein
MESSKEQQSRDSSGDHPGKDYTPLGETMLDRYGRRSQAWRHNTSGEMTTETALCEATTTYKPQLNFFRRQDNMTCLTISIFGGIKNTLIKEIVGLLFLPVMVTYAGYAYLMFRWDAWRTGPQA